jgi:hypothetical protein
MASGKKADDLKIVELNSVGISLSSIGRRLGIHHTTVTSRLKMLGIPPADTRRAFMEVIYDGLSPQQQEWLIDQLSAGQNVQDLIKGLLIKEFINRKP